MLDSITNLFSDLFGWSRTVARFIREGEGEIESENLYGQTPRDVFTVAPPLPELARVNTAAPRRFLYLADTRSPLSSNTARQLTRADRDQVFLLERNVDKSAATERIAQAVREMNPTLQSPVVVVSLDYEGGMSRAITGVLKFLFPEDEWKDLGEHIPRTMQQSAVMVAQVPAIREDKGSILFRLNDGLDNLIRQHAHRWGGSFLPKEKPIPMPRSSDVAKAQKFLNTAPVGGQSVGVYQLDQGDRGIFTDQVETGAVRVGDRYLRLRANTADQGVEVRKEPAFFSHNKTLARWGSQLLALRNRFAEAISLEPIYPGVVHEYKLPQPGAYSWATRGVEVRADGQLVGRSQKLTLSALPSLPQLTHPDAISHRRMVSRAVIRSVAGVRSAAARVMVAR